MKCEPTPVPGQVADGRNESGALPELFALFQPELLGALFCVTGNWEDARDALQETFLKCWRRQEQLAEIENFKAWIFKIALNTGRDARRTASRRKRQPFDGEETMLLANHAPPDDALETADELVRVRKAVAALRPEEQEVFLLRQSAQLSYDEIARTIEIPLGTVKTRMRMALANLRTALIPPTA